MGVTTLETADAIYHLDHERHNREFTLERRPNEITAFVVELYANVPPTDPHIPFGSDSKFVNGVFEAAKRNKKGVWITDVPFKDFSDGREAATEVLETIERAHSDEDLPEAALKLAGGAAAIGAGGFSLFKYASGSRRRFLKVGGAALVAGGMILGSDGVKIIGEEISRDNLVLLELNRSLSKVREVPMDDRIRVKNAESKWYMHSPRDDLRNIINAVKIEWLAKHLKQGLDGEKPQLYLVYTAPHTRILDYLDNEGKQHESLDRWRGQADTYLHKDWIGAITHWRKSADAPATVYDSFVESDVKTWGWLATVDHPELPKLEMMRGLQMQSVDTIEPKDEQISRRNLLRRAISGKEKA